jgi:hypothetical protein
LDLKGKPGADSGSVRGHRNIRLAKIVADEEQLLSGHRDDLYTEPEKKLIQPALTLVSETPLHDDSGLHQRGGGKVRG